MMAAQDALPAAALIDKVEVRRDDEVRVWAEGKRVTLRGTWSGGAQPGSGGWTVRVERVEDDPYASGWDEKPLSLWARLFSSKRGPA